jgi:hypothetical protein
VNGTDTLNKNCCGGHFCGGGRGLVRTTDTMNEIGGGGYALVELE